MIFRFEVLSNIEQASNFDFSDNSRTILILVAKRRELFGFLGSFSTFILQQEIYNHE